MAASSAAVRSAVAALPRPDGVVEIAVDDRSVTDTFGCRIAVDLTGTFDEQRDGLSIARQYAKSLSAALGVPAFAFPDLLELDSPHRFLQ
jgi:hypothetical protein